MKRWNPVIASDSCRWCARFLPFYACI